MSAYKKIKILYIDSSLGFGGSTVCLKNLITGLDKNKYETAVAYIFQKENSSTGTFMGGVKAYYLRGIGTDAYLAAVSAIRNNRLLKKAKIVKIITFFVNLFFERMFSFSKIFLLIKKEKIDVVHFNNGISKSVIMACKSARIPCLCTVRSFSNRDKFSTFYWKNNTRFVAVSNAVRNDFINNRGVDAKLVNVIYDGIEVPLKLSDLSISSNSSDGTKIIGTVGRLLPWKRQDLLIKAAVDLMGDGKSISCVVVGGSEDDAESKEYSKMLKDMAVDLDKKIIFVDFSSNALEIMNQFDVFVLPSITEPFGMVVLEAMALGKPVVAFNAGGPAEIIRDREDGILVKPGDESGLKKAILDLLSDNILASRISENAYPAVRDRFPLNKTIKEYSMMYDELLGSVSRRVGHEN